MDGMKKALVGCVNLFNDVPKAKNFVWSPTWHNFFVHKVSKIIDQKLEINGCFVILGRTNGPRGVAFERNFTFVTSLNKLTYPKG